jgi:hypothetical protein
VNPDGFLLLIHLCGYIFTLLQIVNLYMWQGTSGMGNKVQHPIFVEMADNVRQSF